LNEEVKMKKEEKGQGAEKNSSFYILPSNFSSP